MNNEKTNEKNEIDNVQDTMKLPRKMAKGVSILF